jgi:hypothetical protein
MLMASGAAYEGGRALGLDLSGGLLTGTLPFPHDTKGPFGIYPFVPPAMQIPGNIIQAAIEGDPRALQQTLPLLVPGGIAASRAIGYVPGVGGEGTAKLLGRYYADYKMPTPDGRVPVFSHDGNLIGYETIGQITAKAVGIPGAGGEVRNETEILQWLVQNRDRAREARRGYLEALFRNDTSAMMQVRESYESTFGVPLTIKETHVKAYQLRRDVPRIERVLATLPEDIRPQFAAILQQAIFAEGSGFLGIPPEELGRGTPSSRMPLRATRPSGFNRQGSYTTDMSPMRKLNLGGMGRNQLPSTSSLQGLSFGGL